MFGVEKFDVVIGNPPYIFSRENLNAERKKYFKKEYELTQFKINLYILFIEKGSKLLNRKDGVLYYIIPNNWLTLSTTSDLRAFILKKTKIDFQSTESVPVSLTP
jgi:tRNA1(Val) A37 N6-methylase TrmN6